MVNVRIHEDTLKSMIDERIAYWAEQIDDILLEMVTEYFYELIDGGCFEGIELDIMVIVDNAVINDFDVSYENGIAKLIDCRSGEVILEKEWQE